MRFRNTAPSFWQRKFQKSLMGVNLTFKFLADHFEADRKHVKILVFSFSSKAGSQASQKGGGGGTTLKSDPPDAENLGIVVF